MLLKNSRYQPARAFVAAEDRPLFSGIRARALGPAAGVIEHMVATGERLDGLAYHYYNDSRLWWRILDANPDVLFGGDLLLDDFAGQTLLIPRARE